MIPGEVKKCPHCDGRGACANVFSRSCAACAAHAGLDPNNQWQQLACSACGGKGFNWIGPALVALQDAKEAQQAAQGQP